MRPSTPVVAVVIAAAVIVGIALLVNAAHARGLLPNCLVHPCPILLFANGEQCAQQQPRDSMHMRSTGSILCSSAAAHTHAFRLRRVIVPAGQMLSDNLRRCMLAPEKVHSELRVKGHASMSKVFAVVLEPTGTFSVITQGECLPGLRGSS